MQPDTQYQDCSNDQLYDLTQQQTQLLQNGAIITMYQWMAQTCGLHEAPAEEQTHTTEQSKDQAEGGKTKRARRNKNPEDEHNQRQGPGDKRQNQRTETDPKFPKASDVPHAMSGNQHGTDTHT